MQYDDLAHKYSNKGEVYTSVTQFIEKFHKDFEENKEYWLYYKAVQYCTDWSKPDKINKYDPRLDNLINKTLFTSKQGSHICRSTLKLKDPEAIRLMIPPKDLEEIQKVIKIIDLFWQEKNNKAKLKGNILHTEQEEADYRAKSQSFGSKIYDVIRVPPFQILDLQSGIYPELKVYNHQYKLGGTIDRPIFDGKKVYIQDYKTNEEIVESNKYQKMYEPIAHLDDCNLTHYTLQLSLYGYMLEELGYKIVGLELIAIDSELLGSSVIRKGEKSIKVPYLKNDVINMLEYASKKTYKDF